MRARGIAVAVACVVQVVTAGIVDIRVIKETWAAACYPSVENIDVYGFAEQRGKCGACEGGVTTDRPPALSVYHSEIMPPNVSVATILDCTRFYPASSCVPSFDTWPESTLRFLLVESDAQPAGNRAFQDSGDCNTTSDSSTSAMLTDGSPCSVPLDTVDLQLTVSLAGACREWATFYAPVLPLPTNEGGVFELGGIEVFSSVEDATVTVTDMDGGVLKLLGSGADQLTMRTLSRGVVYWPDLYRNETSVAKTVTMTVAAAGRPPLSVTLAVAVRTAPTADVAALLFHEQSPRAAVWNFSNVWVHTNETFTFEAASPGAVIKHYDAAGAQLATDGSVEYSSTGIAEPLANAYFAWDAPSDAPRVVEFRVTPAGGTLPAVGATLVVRLLPARWLEVRLVEAGAGGAPLAAVFPSDGLAFVGGYETCGVPCEFLRWDAVPEPPSFAEDSSLDALMFLACVQNFAPASDCVPEALPPSPRAADPAFLMRFVFVHGTPPPAGPPGGGQECVEYAVGAGPDMPEYRVAGAEALPAGVQFVVPVVLPCPRAWVRVHLAGGRLAVDDAGRLAGVLGCTSHREDVSLAFWLDGAADEFAVPAGTCREVTAWLSQNAVVLPNPEKVSGPTKLHISATTGGQVSADSVGVDVEEVINPSQSPAPPTEAPSSTPEPTAAPDAYNATLAPSATDTPQTPSPPTAAPDTAVPASEEAVTVLLAHSSALPVDDYNKALERIGAQLQTLTVIAIKTHRLCKLPAHRVAVGIQPADEDNCQPLELTYSTWTAQRPAELLQSVVLDCASSECVLVLETTVYLLDSSSLQNFVARMIRDLTQPGKSLWALGFLAVETGATTTTNLNLAFNFNGLVLASIDEEADRLTATMLALFAKRGLPTASITIEYFCGLPVERAWYGIREADMSNADLCVRLNSSARAAPLSVTMRTGDFNVAWCHFVTSKSEDEVEELLEDLFTTPGVDGMMMYGLKAVFHTRIPRTSAPSSRVPDTTSPDTTSPVPEPPIPDDGKENKKKLFLIIIVAAAVAGIVIIFAVVMRRRFSSGPSAVEDPSRRPSSQRYAEAPGANAAVFDSDPENAGELEMSDVDLED